MVRTFIVKFATIHIYNMHNLYQAYEVENPREKGELSYYAHWELVYDFCIHG